MFSKLLIVVEDTEGVVVMLSNQTSLANVTEFSICDLIIVDFLMLKSISYNYNCFYYTFINNR